MEKQITEGKDVLRARFTSWLTTLLWRARIDYVRSKAKEVKTVPIDDLNEVELAMVDHYLFTESEFQFEEKRLAEAFFSLPLLRQRILTMLFVEGLTPAEISQVLHCHPNYVSVQRHRALKELRKMLTEEGGE